VLFSAALLLLAGPAHGGFLDGLDEVGSGSELRRLWLEGQELERAGRLLEAVERFERVSRAQPGQADPLWRLARTYWRLGEQLDVGDREGRLHYFERADASAARSLEIDPSCAECMLWRAASLGRLATTRGVVSAARQAAYIADLLERGIALAPTYRDSDYNTTLGNLYHAAAAFYRLVPDWFWLEWMIGVRGDKQRSVEYSRRAVSISTMRLDYQVELGAGLLCLGTAQNSAAHVREGREILRRSQELAPILATDAIDLAYARIMLEQPERACTYARDGFVELDEVGLGPPS
jgi:tetratricopeptide (TPR) repeat protein